MQSALRDDALTSTRDGFELRVGLPWIRSLPLAGLGDLSVTVDGQGLPDGDLRVVLGGERLSLPELAEDGDTWWFLQDRLVVAGARRLTPGRHQVEVGLRMTVPYLPGGPDAPLVLPLRMTADLELDHSPCPGAGRDVVRPVAAPSE